MKISSKSILSPCRGRNTPISLSTSLSRRLRTNASLKGGQSPMFPTSGKKRGCALENPGEPSSPKVTCIGQVRVKTKKKQGKRMRGGEVGVGFRRVEQSREGLNNNHPNQIQNQECLKHRNQRWVHLPLSICEALRGFGSEFSCLFQCGREKEEKTEKTETGERSLRRHVDLGEKIEIEEEKWEVNDCIVEEEEEEAESRVSICIPPKNALLLMRCRSDPMRMSALTNRLWELQSAPEGEEDKEEEEEEEEEEEDNDDHDHEEIEMSENLTSIKANEEEENPESELPYLAMEVQEDEEKENPEDKLEIIQEEDDEEEEKQEMSSLSEAFADPEKLENEEEEKEDASNLIQERESHHSSSSEDETEEKETQQRLESEERERESHENLERENEEEEEERERRSVLPDCLLLMMREPKLSMEVSEETWVCSTDFIRWLPDRPVNTKDGSDDPKKRISIDSNNPVPPRSSCSFPAPAAMSMAATIEQKLLKRCKSEPRRSAAAKLAPETCFWKNRKLEPHRRATFGVGAAGVGF